uniref:Melanocortin 1 receptor n=1 Tax=Coturnix japonica TaxID=93934 RepID=Q59I34_COTJA|nr:melanocortin 1 receptor [Coturnix japonica]
MSTLAPLRLLREPWNATEGNQSNTTAPGPAAPGARGWTSPMSCS